MRQILSWWNPLGWLRAGLSAGDIVHAQWWSFFLAPAYLITLLLARLRRRIVIVTLHNVEPHEGGVLRRLVNRSVLPLAHHVIVHSDANKKALVGLGFEASRISVIPHGISDPIETDECRRKAARLQLNLPPNASIALFLGNIRPYKGVDVLLEAFVRVRRVLPDALLAVVGQQWSDGPDVGDLIRALPLEGAAVAVLEYVSSDEMTLWLDAADLAVYPYTHFDAQSGAACDALRRSCPIVVTSVGGLSSLVSDDRAIVPPKDAEALAQAIERVLADRVLREKLSIDAMRTARETSWTAVSVRTACLYESLLQRRGSNGSSVKETAATTRIS